MTIKSAVYVLARLLALFFSIVLLTLLFLKIDSKNNSSLEYQESGKFSTTKTAIQATENFNKSMNPSIPLFYLTIQAFSLPNTYYPIYQRNGRKEIGSQIQSYVDDKKKSNDYLTKRKTEFNNSCNIHYKTEDELQNYSSSWKNFVPKIVFTKKNRFHFWLLSFFSTENRIKIKQLSNKLLKSILLLFFSILLSTIISIPIGILCTIKNNLFSNFLLLIVLITFSLPGFIFIPLLLIACQIFSWKIPFYFSFENEPISIVGKLFLGVNTNSIFYYVFSIAVMVFLFSSTFIYLVKNIVDEENTKPYTITLHAKGLTEKKINYKHALKNGIDLIITSMSAFLVGGLFTMAIAESILGYPGIVSDICLAIQNNDKQMLIDLLLLLSFYTHFILQISEMIKKKFQPHTIAKIK